MHMRKQFDDYRLQNLQRRLLSEARLESAETQDHVSGCLRGRTAAHVLSDIVDQYFDGDAELKRVACELAAAGEEGLQLLQAGDKRTLAHRPDLVSGLEAIVMADGSRPSFLVRNGAVDLQSCPADSWAETIALSGDLLAEALPAAGRINCPDAPQGFAGSGFLVAPGVVMTNRHVLQMIADPTGDGSWQFREGVQIDFGHEYQGIDSHLPRELRTVLYAADGYIDPDRPLDHALLDLVLIELNAATCREQTPLQIDVSVDWPAPELAVYIVGYPAHPLSGYSLTLLEKLFQLTFGRKRLAPGRVLKPAGQGGAWTMSHDATTLGGNSGSVVLVAGRETLAAALHYGGKKDVANYGHVIGATLSHKGTQGKTLEQVLRERGARLVKRNVS